MAEVLIDRFAVDPARVEAKGMRLPRPARATDQAGGAAEKQTGRGDRHFDPLTSKRVPEPGFLPVVRALVGYQAPAPGNPMKARTLG